MVWIWFFIMLDRLERYYQAVIGGPSIHEINSTVNRIRIELREWMDSPPIT